MPADTIDVNRYKNIPLELRKLKQWVVYKNEHKTRIPYQVAGRCQKKASSSDPSTWTTFGAASAAVKNKLADGIGFVFTSDDPYTGIDLDNKQDDAEKAADNDMWVTSFDSYTERSPSGMGYHIIVKGEVGTGINKDGFEAYSQGRYFTFTGDVDQIKPIVDGGDTLAEFVNTYGSGYGQGGEPEPYEIPETLEEWAAERNNNVFKYFSSELSRRRPRTDRRCP